MVLNQSDEPGKQEKSPVSYNVPTTGSINPKGEGIPTKIYQPGIGGKVPFIILLIAVSLIVPYLNAWPLFSWWPREYWPGFIVSFLINILAFYFGFKGLFKVEKITIREKI